MIRTVNLKIDPKAVVAFPESLAREQCVLPISLDGEAIRVVFGRRDDYRESIEILRFVLSRKIIGFVADLQRIERAIDEVYSHSETEISNCTLDFQFQCPKKWLELTPTSQSNIRFCSSCSKEVYLCTNENVATEQTQSGHCVAIERSDQSLHQLVMGLVETFPIDRENEPILRAALRTLEDPQAILAASHGEFYFLDTKVFDIGYMEFCDQWAANKSRSEASRNEIIKRRDALRPFLGMPILHGGLSHDGLSFNVFVDKTTGKSIVFEKRREPS